MTITQEAVKVAAACIKGGSTFDQEQREDMARAALEAALPHLALAEPPAQRPVAWQYEQLHVGLGGEAAWHLKCSHEEPCASTIRPDIRNIKPLFVAPQPAPAQEGDWQRGDDGVEQLVCLANRLEEQGLLSTSKVVRDAVTVLRSKQVPTVAVTDDGVAVKGEGTNTRTGGFEFVWVGEERFTPAEIVAALRARAEQQEAPGVAVGEEDMKKPRWTFDDIRAGKHRLATSFKGRG